MRSTDRAAAWPVIAAAGIASAVAITTLIIASRRPRLTRQRLRIPIALAPGAPTDQQITGWLCYRGDPAAKSLQVLVHGLSYGASYWDFPHQPQRYSYVRAATAAGFATFALDRPGVGASSKPLAADLTADSEAYAIRQVIDALRDRGSAGAAFQRVVLVGHSFGSYIAMVVAGRHGGVDGVILTGAMHATNAATRAQIRARNYPAADDPKFTGAGLPAGYLTTRPGAKGPDFYNLAYADPRVITVDEELKQTETVPEAASIDEVASDPALTRQIAVPVLLVVGQDDTINGGPGLSCADQAAVLARESGFYGPAARLRGYVLPRAGHAINLHPGAPRWFAAANRWIRALSQPE